MDMLCFNLSIILELVEWKLYLKNYCIFCCYKILYLCIFFLKDLCGEILNKVLISNLVFNL